MAEVFKNAYHDVTSSAAQAYIAPAGKTVVVLSLRIANVNATATDYINAEVIDSDTTTKAFLAKEVDVPFDSVLELAGSSKIVLEAGDKIELQGGQSSGYLEAHISVLEIDN